MSESFLIVRAQGEDCFCFAPDIFPPAPAIHTLHTGACACMCSARVRVTAKKRARSVCASGRERENRGGVEGVSQFSGVGGSRRREAARRRKTKKPPKLLWGDTYIHTGGWGGGGGGRKIDEESTTHSRLSFLPSLPQSLPLKELHSSLCVVHNKRRG